MTDLSTDREKALEQIAKGWGRTATTAHPMCRCGKPYLPTCRICEARPEQPCRFFYWDPMVLSQGGLQKRHYRFTFVASQRQCPVHKPAPRTRKAA